MNAEETTESDDLIRGKCEVNGNILIVLYDSNATHSFISHDCIGRLGLSASKMPYVLLVSTPTVKPVRTRLCCLKCQFHINGRTYESDLICLPLSGLDLILGMDWLLANHSWGRSCLSAISRLSPGGYPDV